MPTYTTDAQADEPSRSGLIAVGFFLLAVVVLFLPDPAQERLASVLRNTILRPFVMVQEGVARREVHAADTEMLQSQLDSLASVILNQNTLLEENGRLRRLLDISERLDDVYVAASVIRPGTTGSESMFMLDVGTLQGVGSNTPVIMGRGLLGVVREAEENTSWGMDWTNPEFRASAMTRDGVEFGMVRATSGGFREADRLLLDGVPFHQELEAGDVVVTSGLGGVYPRGIPIGEVLEEAGTRAGWERSYWLRPFVFPGEASHVLVLERGARDGDVSAVWHR